MWDIFINNFFAKLLEDVTTYFRLYDFLRIKAKNYSQKKIVINSEDEFWYNILGDKFFNIQNQKYYNIENGQVIKFNNCFLTDWSPKLPGRIWTKEGRDLFKSQNTDYGQDFIKINNKLFYVFHPYIKKQIISAGYGSVRVNPSNNNENNYSLMTLVSPEENWHVDYGIPIVVSRTVYEEWLKYSKEGSPWVEECEGILILNRDLPLSTFIPSALGYKISEELQDTLTHKPNLPKCYVYVGSKLNIKFRTNNSHPNATAWAIYETKDTIDTLQYTYVGFNPYNDESVNNSINFINEYVKKHNGIRIITDFDGVTPRLEAEITLDNDPIIYKKETCKKVVEMIDTTKIEYNRAYRR